MNSETNPPMTEEEAEKALENDRARAFVAQATGNPYEIPAPAPKRYKGNQIVCIRMEAEFLKQIDEEIEKVNERRIGEPYDRSMFIRAAVIEKINHYKRSRTKRN